MHDPPSVCILVWEHTQLLTLQLTQIIKVIKLCLASILWKTAQLFFIHRKHAWSWTLGVDLAAYLTGVLINV